MSLFSPCRESNPEIQQWMKEHNYTDYSKLEQYYETTYVKKMFQDFIVSVEIEIETEINNIIMGYISCE